MVEFVDYIALILRAFRFMPELEALILGSGAFLMGIALARIVRRLGLRPGRRLWCYAAFRPNRSNHRHSTVNMHRGASQIARLR